MKKANGSATDPTTFKLENITLNRPGRVINRPDHLGAPNGWVLEEDQETGSAVIQIAALDLTKDYPAIGWYFEEDFGATDSSERWVITNVGQVYDMNGYFKANIDLQLDRSGTGSNSAFS